MQSNDTYDNMMVNASTNTITRATDNAEFLNNAANILKFNFRNINTHNLKSILQKSENPESDLDELFLDIDHAERDIDDIIAFANDIKKDLKYLKQNVEYFSSKF